MSGNWRRYGSEFPGLLFIAAYTLTGASFQRMPKLEDFAGGRKEIDGFDVWGALRKLYAWLKPRRETFPFSRAAIFREPRDIGVDETASILLEMTTLQFDGHLPERDRKNAAHYGQCEFCLATYKNTINAFLENLYWETDFDNTNLGSQIVLATSRRECRPCES